MTIGSKQQIFTPVIPFYKKQEISAGGNTQKTIFALTKYVK